MKPLQSLFALLAAFQAGPAPAADAPAPPDKANTFFGIRLGEPLKSQCSACPDDSNPTGRLPDRPCWFPDPLATGAHSVRLSLGVFQELGRIEVRRLREVGGVVVEVEAEFPPSDAKRVERYLRKRLGPPTSSEPYERDSRLFGLRKAMAYSWQGAGATLNFLENSASGNGSAHWTLDSWAEQAAREEKFWREREQKGSSSSTSKPPVLE